MHDSAENPLVPPERRAYATPPKPVRFYKTTAVGGTDLSCILTLINLDRYERALKTHGIVIVDEITETWPIVSAKELDDAIYGTEDAHKWRRAEQLKRERLRRERKALHNRHRKL